MSFLKLLKANSNKGFTLIEMLIVMSIIAILAVFSVRAFTAYRESAVLELAKDNITSLLSEARNNVMSGHANSDGEPVCFGVLLEKGKKTITKLQWPYDSRDYLDDNREYQSGRCRDIDFNDPKIVRFNQEQKEGIEFAKFTLGEDQELDHLVFLFAPPEGNLDDSFINVGLRDISFVEITVVDSANNERSFKIDLNNGFLQNDK